MISNSELKQKIEDFKAGKSLMLVEPMHDHVLRLLAENDALKAAGNITLSGCELRLRDLIWGVMHNVKGPSKYRSKYGAPRWVLVRNAFAVGSGVATALCREFGLDPDEELRS
jgi:hypothetical protein